eukprot:m.9760 g.9760  ORF g.9760 m.9760 type:complete len:93 (+) comp21613_c0_seq1:60-338(+)
MRAPAYYHMCILLCAVLAYFLLSYTSLMFTLKQHGRDRAGSNEFKEYINLAVKVAITSKLEGGFLLWGPLVPCTLCTPLSVHHHMQQYDLDT